MTAEQAYQAVVDAVEGINVAAITGASERRGRFTHDPGNPAEAELMERVFRLDLVEGPDEPGADGFMGCRERHERYDLRLCYEYTDDAQKRALRDTEALITALQAINSNASYSGQITVQPDGTAWTHGDEAPGWLVHHRYLFVHHRGT